MDLLLAVMVLIWAGNFAIVKAAFQYIPALPFNAVRLVIATTVFLVVIWWGRSAVGGRAHPVLASRRPLDRRDWALVAVLGIVGHLVYQLFFVYGLDKTSVANSALIIGCTPVAVALFTAAVGQERVTGWHWVSAVLSVVGLYLVAGRGAAVSRESLIGDACMVGALLSWATYTVLAKPLLSRHSPLVVTTYTMAIGTVAFVVVSLPGVLRVDWASVPPAAYVAVLVSALLALNVGYMIWYIAVQRLGNATTAMYSNVVPVVAMFIAWLTLDEHIDAVKIAGAASILTGVAVTRFGARVRQQVAGVWRKRVDDPTRRR